MVNLFELIKGLHYIIGPAGELITAVDTLCWFYCICCLFVSILVDLWWNICQNIDVWLFYALKSKKASQTKNKIQPTARKLKVLGCPGFYVLLARRFKGCFTSIPHWFPIISYDFPLMSFDFPWIFYSLPILAIYCLYIAYILDQFRVPVEDM